MKYFSVQRKYYFTLQSKHLLNGSTCRKWNNFISIKANRVSCHKTLLNIPFFGVIQHLYWENSPFFLLMVKYSGTHHNGITINFFFNQKREKLHDEEERKSAWVSQERQKTLDRLRNFKQVVKVWSVYYCSLLFKQLHIYSYCNVSFMRKTWFSFCYLKKFQSWQSWLTISVV